MPLTHLDDKGRVRMVDVGDKPITTRTAVARGRITMSRQAFEAVTSEAVKKGNVITSAQIAGIMAAKNTGHVIPLCHPLPLDHVTVELSPDADTCSILAEVTVRTDARTGAEMEALYGVSVALLTIYDMVKALDRSMTIDGIMLVEKSGGKSGRYTRE